MATVTQPNVSLSLTLDGVEVQCQVITAEISLPGLSSGDSVEVACPEGMVKEPGTPEDGALTGEVYADSQDSGITWALGQAYMTDATVQYVATWWEDLGETIAMRFSGDARVSSFVLPWEKPAYGKHSIDLALITATIDRPAPVA